MRSMLMIEIQEVIKTRKSEYQNDWKMKSIPRMESFSISNIGQDVSD